MSGGNEQHLGQLELIGRFPRDGQMSIMNGVKSAPEDRSGQFSLLLP